MAGKGALDGWAGIIDPEEVELPTDSARADPDLDPITQADAPAVDDPVLAAMLELDGDPSHGRSPLPRSDTEPNAPPGLKIPDADTAPELRLPTPDANAKPTPRLSLPSPPATAAKPAIASPELNQDKLLAGLSSKPRSEIAARVPGGRRKEPLITAAVAVVLLLGILVYQWIQPSPADEPAPQARSVAAQRRAAINRARAGQVNTTPPATQTPGTVAPGLAPTTTPSKPAIAAPEVKQAPVKAAIPMLSILSTPAGAEVEIDGKAAGRTPVIRPSPQNGPPIKIKVSLKRYETWEEAVYANEAGHYVAQVELRKRKQR